MTMRALIQRNTAGATRDGLNQPAKPSYTTHISSQPCWMWTEGKREVNDTNKIALIEDMRMLVPIDADITEADQISNVRDRLGAVIFSGRFLIDAVQKIPNSHLELMLRQID